MKITASTKSCFLSFFSISSFIVLFFILNLLWIGCTGFNNGKSHQIQNLFKNPPSAYLPTVYWFWNGTIEPDQIKSQLEEMKRSHTVGSVCILAWEGLAMAYLSDEWFDKVKYACQIAKQLGLDIWLYDEIRWPSGHAGGKVLDSNPELRATCLSQTEKKVTGNQRIILPIQYEPVAIIAAQVKNHILAESTLLDVTCFFDGTNFSWNVPAGDWSIFFYSIVPCTFKPTFLDREYVDLLNPQVVQKFINLTHKEYYQRMPEYFGSVIKAIITDEPGCYCNLKAFLINPETIAWTPGFLAAFRSRKNYDLKKFLPALWHDIGNRTVRIRIDFYDVIADLLQESYLKPLHDWCESHKIKLNIQPAHEETIKYSTLMQGNYFQAMEYSHLPGCDDVYSWDRNRITPKLAASAARSFGHQDVYCEVFAAYGWAVTLQQMKAVTDWLFTRGVNRLLLSSFYFASEGDWRFEIPPSLFHQNTLWPYLPNYTRYVQRLSFLLSGGRSVAPIAILYPNKSVQAALSPLDEKLADQIDNTFIGLSNFLLGRQLDYDYLDERALGQAEIKTVGNRVVLRMKQKEFSIDYELVLIPQAKIIKESTFKKLKNFYDRGGRIIAYGNLPQVSSSGMDLTAQAGQIWRDPAGTNSNDDGGKAFFVKSNFDSIQAIIESEVNSDIRLEPANEKINCIHKIKNGLDIYFIANSDSVPVATNLIFLDRGIPQIWNAEDGTIANAAQFQQVGDRTIVPLHLDRYGALLIVFDQNGADAPHVVKSNMTIEGVEMKGDSVVVSASAVVAGENFIVIAWKGKEFKKSLFANPPELIEITDSWNFKSADNSFPEEMRSSGSWTEQQNITQIDGAKIAPAHPYFSGTGIYSQKFYLKKSLIGVNQKIILKAGQVNDIMEVWLNGKKVGTRCWQPFSFDLTDYLNEGKNEIELRITNTPANAYLLHARPYRLGENWGRVAKSGLLENVRLEIYKKYDFLFSLHYSEKFFKAE